LCSLERMNGKDGLLDCHGLNKDCRVQGYAATMAANRKRKE
jgi:hypothetical protein